MDFFMNMIKGAIIGIANIIPGVSGGTMALTFNLYDQLIDAIGNFFKDIKKNILFLMPIGIGAIIGIVLFSSIIKYSLEHYCMIVNFFFIGLVAGSIPLIYKHIKGTQVHKSSFLSFILAFAIMVLLSIFSFQDTSVITTLSFGVFMKLFFCSIIAASCMILPGISGSLVLMILGCYTTVLTAITDRNIFMLVPVGLGAMIGILGGAKIIDICFKKFKQATYFAILGLIIGSFVSLIQNAGIVFSIDLVFAVIAFGIGLFITLFFDKLDQNRNN